MTDTDPVAAGLLDDARYARDVAAVMREQERVAVTAFMDHARRHGWPWLRIGIALGISDNAARNYFERNNEKATE